MSARASAAIISPGFVASMIPTSFAGSLASSFL